MVKIGLAIVVTTNSYARIATHSRLTIKRSIDVGAGVVDVDYHGEVGVVLINNSDGKFPLH